MSRQKAGRRDPGKSLAQPANSVSFFVSRRVLQASKAIIHFLLPCIQIHDDLVARDTLIWWMSFHLFPTKGIVTVVWAMGSAWGLGHFQYLPG